MHVHGLIVGQLVDVERKHRLRVQLVAEVLLDLGKVFLARDWGLVRNRFDTLFCLLHNVLILETIDVALLALHVRIEKGTSLQSQENESYL